MSVTKIEDLEITKSSGNVFADLGIPDAEKYLVRAELARQINNIIQEKGWKQKETAEILEIDQPKVSALNCGHLDKFSIEQLIAFLNKLDRDVKIVVEKKRSRQKGHGHLTVAFA
jgi:predicted XRE-type DNA-binding protein